MKKDAWVKGLFQAIDQKDTNAFLGFLSDDVSFRFGNVDPVRGKDSVGEAVSGFFQSIKDLRHDDIESWEESGTLICRGTATYTRHDSSQLTVPFANIIKLDGDAANEYGIYVDISELYRS